MMPYNPKLVEQLLGENVADLLDGTIEIIPAKYETFCGLKVGDTLEFKFKQNNDLPLRQFVVSWKY